MQYWWVNHNQTFKQEIEVGHIWSPKTNRDGSYNHSYENLTKVNKNAKNSWNASSITADGRPIKLVVLLNNGVSLATLMIGMPASSK